MQKSDETATDLARSSPFVVPTVSSGASVHGPAARAGRLCWHAAWQQAFTAARHAATFPGLVLIVGQPGTGKSLLLSTVGCDMAAPGLVIRNWDDVSDKSAVAADVLLIDDADSLPPDVLRRFALTRRRCIAIGSRSLAGKLNLRAGRLTVVELGCVTAADARWFIETTMPEIRGGKGLVADDAVQAMHRESGGVPRRLLALTSLAVFLAQLEDSDRIEAAHVAIAASSIDEVELSEAEDGIGVDGASPLSTVLDELPNSPAAPRASRNLVAPMLLAGGLLYSGTLGDPAFVAPRQVSQEFAAYAAPKDADFIFPPIPAPAARQEAALDAPVTNAPAALAPPPVPGRAVPEGSSPLSAGLPPLHVQVKYSLGNLAAQKQALLLASALRRKGFDVFGPVPDTARLRSPGITYFFENDRARAVELADASAMNAGQPTMAASSGSHRPGAVEISLPLTGPGPAPPSAAGAVN